MAGLGRKVWGNEVLSQPDLQGYLQDQVVMVFANDAERGAEIPVPEEGMISYLKSTHRWEGYSPHPTTGAAGWRALTNVPPQEVALDVSKANHYAATAGGASSGIARVRVWAQGRTAFMSGLLQLTAAIGANVEQTVGTLPTGLAPGGGREIFVGAPGPTSGQRFDVYPAGGASDRAVKIVAPPAGLMSGLTIGMASHWCLD